MITRQPTLMPMLMNASASLFSLCLLSLCLLPLYPLSLSLYLLSLCRLSMCVFSLCVSVSLCILSVSSLSCLSLCVCSLCTCVSALSVSSLCYFFCPSSQSEALDDATDDDAEVTHRGLRWRDEAVGRSGAHVAFSCRHVASSSLQSDNDQETSASTPFSSPSPCDPDRDAVKVEVASPLSAFFAAPSSSPRPQSPRQYPPFSVGSPPVLISRSSPSKADMLKLIRDANERDLETKKQLNAQNTMMVSIMTTIQQLVQQRADK